MPAATASFLAPLEMAQPAYIELRTGADRFYTLSVWSAWLVAALAASMQSDLLPWAARTALFGLLIVLWPGIRHPVRRSSSLRLARDGKAVLGGEEGMWGRYARSCRRYSILRIDLPQRRKHVLLSASRNDPGEYRRLLIWVRLGSMGESADPGIRCRA